MENVDYIKLKDLQVYQLARKLSKIAWSIFSQMTYEQKKIIGDQFIRSADSVGANITEGYARFHYRDKVNFYLYSRGSLSEAVEHWAELMLEREIITQETFNEIKEVHTPLEVKLNNFITTTRKKAQK
jgi:four helix bundle protein